MKRLLIIDDDTSLCYSLQRVLTKTFKVDIAHNSKEMMGKCSANHYDVFLLDYRLGDENGLELLSKLISLFPQKPVIMMTAYGTNQTILEAMQKGATDYLVKPVSKESLISTLKACTHKRTLCSKESFKIHEVTFKEGDFIGSSAKIREVLKTIPLIGSTHSPVFISGESGTGKEVIAKLIHQFSKDRSGQFIPVNCAAIPDTLLESELFGHVKGAFTSAHQDKKGKFECAQKGTLFLDEIGEMPLSLQPKLLRVIQESQVERIGSTQLQDLDVRVVSASNKPLAELVSKGKFREDLFFRLNVLNVDLPPLRERKEDLKELLLYFAQRFAKKYQREIQCISNHVLGKLEDHYWPGNIREFQNVVQRAIIFCKSDCLIPDDFFLDELEVPNTTEGLYRFFRQRYSERLMEQSVAFLEGELIQGVMKDQAGHLFKSAQKLGISRVTLNSKIKKYGLENSGIS